MLSEDRRVCFFYFCVNREFLHIFVHFSTLKYLYERVIIKEKSFLVQNAQEKRESKRRFMVNTRFREQFVAEQVAIRAASPEGLRVNTFSKSKLSRLTEQGRKNAEISPAQKNTPEIMEWRKQ